VLRQLIKKRKFPAKKDAVDLDDDDDDDDPSTDVVVVDDMNTIVRQPKKAMTTPRTRLGLMGSWRWKIIEIAAVIIGWEGCHMLAARPPASLIPVMIPAWFP